MRDDKGPGTQIPTSASLRLIVTAECPFTEVSVFDSQLQLIERNLGYVDLETRPGAYKVRYSTGDATHDDLVLLEDDNAEIDGPLISVRSPAPLARSTTYDDEHGRAAASLAERAGVGDGDQAVLFGMIRSAGRLGEEESLSATLHAPSGEQVADLAKTTDGQSGPGWSAAMTVLPSGTYRLRIARSHHTIEHAVVLLPGTQTQVFVPVPSPASPPWPGRPTDEPAILFGQSARFDVRGVAAGWIETARRRLSLGTTLPLGSMAAERVFAAADVDLTLRVIALHLWWRGLDGSTLPEALRRAAASLPRALTGHPDVLALPSTLRPASHPASVVSRTHVRFALPPMLTSSWQAIVEESANDSTLVPNGSLAARVSNRVYTDGAWLAWQVSESDTRSETTLLTFYDVTRTDVERFATGILEALPHEARVDLAKLEDRELAYESAYAIAKAARLNAFERWIFEYVLRFGITRVQGSPEERGRLASPEWLRRHLAVSFGRPISVLGEVMASMEAKLASELLRRTAPAAGHSA